MSSHVNTTTPDVYVDLRQSTFWSHINFHHLQQLAPQDLHEETITDLLLNEMAGSAYTIEAECPACHSDSCRHWKSPHHVAGKEIFTRQLTKLEEGGNRRRGISPTGADWVLEVRAAAAQAETHNQGPLAIRLLIQAKRLSNAILNDKRKRDQRDRLTESARRLGAAPFYIYYVHQDDAHSTTRCACTAHNSPIDTAILLLPADRAPRASDDDTWLSHAWPLRCIFGCEKLKSASLEPYGALEAFLKHTVPEYEPQRVNTLPQPQGVQTLRVDTSKTTADPGARPKDHGHDSCSGGTPPERPEILIIRTGGPGYSSVDKDMGKEDPRRVGNWIDPKLYNHEWQEATRMYWKINAARALGVEYLVASSKGRALRVYRVANENSVIVHRDINNRVEFRVSEVSPDTDIWRAVSKAAEERLRHIRNQQPCIYCPNPMATGAGSARR